MVKIRGFKQYELNFWRSIFFRYMRESLISGYNVYKKEISLNQPIVLNYLHSQLSLGDKHLEELIASLKNEADLDISQKIKDTVVIRDANYKAKNYPLWINPESQNFYSLEEEKLEPDIFLDYDKPFVIEEIQHDLNIGIENKKELFGVLNVLKKKAPYYLLVNDCSDFIRFKDGFVLAGEKRYRLGDFTKKLDISNIRIMEDGRIENPSRFADGSWEIPLLVLNKVMGDVWFSKVHHFKYRNKDFESFVTFLIKSKRKKFIELSLNDGVLTKLNSEERIRYANNLFIQRYVEIF